MKFWSCFCYLVLLSVGMFFVGRLLPKKWFCAKAFPYRGYRFEREGRIYEKLKIRKWYNKVPDMSRILPFMMPPKKLTADNVEHLPRMIRETCVAELIHLINSIAGFYCVRIYPGLGGILMALLYALLNIPFIMIQRFVRPRLLKLQKHLEERGHRRANCECGTCDNIDENIDSELQYGRGT